MMNNFIKRIETSLQNKSEIVYVFPAIPCFIIFIISIISSSIYITKQVEYKTCTLLHSNESDYLKEYVLGSILVGYIFLAIYSNILLEYIPKVSGLGLSFFLLFTWAIGCFVWNIIGAALVSNSYCKDTSYYGISVMNLVIYFVSFGGLFFYTIFVLIKNFKQNKAASVNPTSAQQQQPANANKDK